MQLRDAQRGATPTRSTFEHDTSRLTSGLAPGVTHFQCSTHKYGERATDHLYHSPLY